MEPDLEMIITKDDLEPLPDVCSDTSSDEELNEIIERSKVPTHDADDDARSTVSISKSRHEIDESDY